MDNFMEQDFIDILKQLVAEQVNAVLTDSKQFKAVLADYTRNEYKKESRFLIQAVEAGVSKAIKEADDLPSCKKAKIHELVEDYGLSQEVSAAIVDTLALVLRGDTSKSVTATPAVEKAAASQPAPVKEEVSNKAVEKLVVSPVTGKGKKTFTDGNVYEGDLINDIPNGKGKMTYADGDVYEGEIKDGKPHGKGKMTYKKSKLYLTWINGERYDIGKNVYEGDWVNGDYHGKGKYTWSNGDVYEGDWVDGDPHGKGKCTWSDGDIYEGDVKRCPEGKGKYTWSNGDVYEGDWKFGRKNGKGKMTYANGKVKEGDWKIDKFKGKGLFG